MQIILLLSQEEHGKVYLNLFLIFYLIYAFIIRVMMHIDDVCIGL